MSGYTTARPSRPLGYGPNSAVRDFWANAETVPTMAYVLALIVYEAHQLPLPLPNKPLTINRPPSITYSPHKNQPNSSVAPILPDFQSTHEHRINHVYTPLQKQA
jgi:hypothetical protein